ncbi:hypothetical protein BTO20_05985 [Mycobacterium dioxanotrophicus]|jgi:hypothetical protein|uniref:Nucleotide pyrophosphohydrolase n=1 Tax=Mycobacterium dioxanotrophicus TaxID=482462 RepID=A0A1Y0BZ51_9MYCO|nr:hypothetical protein [Mycobacterium dioxanotrophicus]ART68193.1 hypothetical protein BTO20_05985 [Mycobacterium dioxanotrophicus]
MNKDIEFLTAVAQDLRSRVEWYCSEQDDPARMHDLVMSLSASMLAVFDRLGADLGVDLREELAKFNFRPER